jgi:hypothetical protein
VRGGEIKTRRVESYCLRVSEGRRGREIGGLERERERD